MSFSQLVVESEGLGAGVEDRFNPYILTIVEKKEGIAVRNSCIGASIARVQFHRVGEHAPRKPVIAFGMPIEKVPAAQVVGICFYVVGGRLRDGLFFLWQQLHL